ncbi:hypothetical protein ACLKA7_016281 [Drosophila subpalustris]
MSVRQSIEVAAAAAAAAAEAPAATAATNNNFRWVSRGAENTKVTTTKSRHNVGAFYEFLAMETQIRSTSASTAVATSRWLLLLLPQNVGSSSKCDGNNSNSNASGSCCRQLIEMPPVQTVFGAYGHLL